MYERFYGLRERPFDLTPNPRYLLLTATHREALSNLEYGISACKGITVLTGEAGTGKTTLIRTAFARANAEREGSAASWAYLKNPRLRRSEFLEFLVAGLGLRSKAAASKTRLLADLERMLLEGRRAALIVDEAQSVPLELLEEIRLLANIQSDTQSLLPIVLAGQPELAERLNEPALRQLKQRVALRCTLATLSFRETAAYIAGRIEIAGGHPSRIFSRQAVMTIYDHSRGIPRTISVICDNALATGYAEEQQPITAKVIDEVCRDFDLARHVTSSSASLTDPDTRSSELAGRRSSGPTTIGPSDATVVRSTEATAPNEGESDGTEPGIVERLRRWGLGRR
jgi:general secretion pathway protein A